MSGDFGGYTIFRLAAPRSLQRNPQTVEAFFASLKHNGFFRMEAFFASLKHNRFFGVLFENPSEPTGVVFALVLGALTLWGLGYMLFTGEHVFRKVLNLYSAVGRVRNTLCGPCDRARKRYPVPATSQIPMWTDVGQIYSFVFGYRTDGCFVEVGAFDGETFGHTSALGDMGWEGHYIEPIPAFAATCAARHKNNAGVKVHNICVGNRDGEKVELSTAGPFSSACADEIEAVNNSKMNDVLSAVGWSHTKGATKIKATTKSLNTFWKEQKFAPGAVHVLVIDVEGLEWAILSSFDLARHRPVLAIVEIQEKQARYAASKKAQDEAAAIEAKFAAADYSILYRDGINTIFIDKRHRCVGGE